MYFFFVVLARDSEKACFLAKLRLISGLILIQILINNDGKDFDGKGSIAVAGISGGFEKNSNKFHENNKIIQ